MAEWYPLQEAFTSGELSPRIAARVDSDAYATGAEVVDNLFLTPQGPLVKRPGTKRYLDLGEFGECRLLPYIFNDDTRGVLILYGEGTAELHRLSDIIGASVLLPPIGVQATGFKEQVVRNPEFTSGLTDWDYTAGWQYSYTPRYREGGARSDTYTYGESVTWSYGVAVREEGQLKYAVLSQSEPDEERDGVLNYDIPEVTLRQAVTVGVPTDVFNGDVRVAIGDGSGDKGYTFRARVYSDSGYSNLLHEEILDELFPAQGFIDRIFSFPAPTGAFTGTLYLEVRFFTGASKDTDTSRSYSREVYVDSFNLYSSSILVPDQTDFAAPYADTELAALQYVQSPHGNRELFITHPNHPTYVLYFDTGLPGMVLEPAVFTDPPPEWTGSNYPAICTAFQGRLLLGATPANSERLWLSVPGDWLNFSKGVGGSDDAIEVDGVYRAPFTWARGHKRLVAGTDLSEMELRAQNGIIQPSDISMAEQSLYGSNSVMPGALGHQIFFSAGAGRKVRSLDLSDEAQGWVSDDFTLLAEHITATGIKEFSSVQTPHQMLMAVLNDGHVAIMHYDRSADMSGWSQFKVGGEVKSACTLRLQGEDVPVVAVVRWINGVKHLVIEYLPRLTDRFSWRYLDSYIELFADNATNVITGLDDYNGALVEVFADKVYRGVYEVSDNTVTLPAEVQATQFIVGFGYSCQLLTFPPGIPDSPSTFMLGGQGAKKRFSSLALKVVESTFPIVNGERPPDRSAGTPMDQTEGMFTGNVHYYRQGYNSDGRLEIREPLPLPLTIIGIYGKLTANKL